MSKKEKWEELYEEYKANNILTVEELEGKWDTQDKEYRKRLSDISDSTSKEYKQLKGEWKKLKAEFEAEKKGLEKYKGIAKNLAKIEKAKSNRDVYQSLLDELLEERKENEEIIRRRTELSKEAEALDKELQELKEIENRLKAALKNPICTQEDIERISKRLSENMKKQSKNQEAFSKNQLALQKELEVSIKPKSEEEIEKQIAEAKEGLDKSNKICELLAEGKTMAEVRATLDKLKPEAAKPKAAEPKEVKLEDTKPEFYVPELEEDEVVQAVTTGKDTTKTKAAESKATEPKATEPKAREKKAAKKGVNIEEERKAMERFQKFTELASRREKIDKTIDEKVGLSEPKDTILKEVRDQFIDWIIDMAVYDETDPSKYSDPKDIPTREEIINKMRKEFKEKYPDKTLEDVIAEEIGSHIEKKINKFKSNVEKQEQKAAEPKAAEPKEVKPEDTKPEFYVPELEEDEVQAVTTGKDTTKTKAAENLPLEDYSYYIPDDVEYEPEPKLASIVIKTIDEQLSVYAFASKEDEIDYKKAFKDSPLSYDDEKISTKTNGFDKNIADFLLMNISFHMNSLYEDGIKKGEKIPFGITYDLRDIYKSNLSNKQIKNLFRIAKQANKINSDIKVEKDNILKRALGRASRFINSSKEKVKSLLPTKKKEMLPNGSDRDIGEDIDIFSQEVVESKKTKTPIVETVGQEFLDISRKISKCSSIEELESTISPFKSFRTYYRLDETSLSDYEVEELLKMYEEKEKELKNPSREQSHSQEEVIQTPTEGKEPYED